MCMNLFLGHEGPHVHVLWVAHWLGDFPTKHTVVIKSEGGREGGKKREGEGKGGGVEENK